MPPAIRSGIADCRGLPLAYDCFGNPGHPPVLLIMGNSAPGLVWPDAFCDQLAARRHHVIRYDQRDTGLSARIDFAAAPYTLHDLADDALALLAALGLPAAHLVGLSQGGTTALLAGLAHPARVRGIATLMSSPDLRPKTNAFAGRPPIPGQLPPPDPAYVRAVIALNATPATTDAAMAERFMENFRLAAGPASPFDPEFFRALGRAVARHGPRAAIANHSNHARAQAATPALTAADLARLTQPCLILHGANDPIFPPAHAEWAAAHIPHARLALLPRMGHALDPSTFPALLDTLHHFLAGS